MDQLSESTSEGGRIRANKSHLPSGQSVQPSKVTSSSPGQRRPSETALRVLREIHIEQRVVPQLKGIGRHGSVSGCGYKRQATPAAKTTPPGRALPTFLPTQLLAPWATRWRLEAWAYQQPSQPCDHQAPCSPQPQGQVHRTSHHKTCCWVSKRTAVSLLHIWVKKICEN